MSFVLWAVAGPGYSLRALWGGIRRIEVGATAELDFERQGSAQNIGESGVSGS